LVIVQLADIFYLEDSIVFGIELKVERRFECSDKVNARLFAIFGRLVPDDGKRVFTDPVNQVLTTTDHSVADDCLVERSFRSCAAVLRVAEIARELEEDLGDAMEEYGFT